MVKSDLCPIVSSFADIGEKGGKRRRKGGVVNYGGNYYFVTSLAFQCRTRAKRIGKHHILNSIVESYLAMHPGDKLNQWRYIYPAVCFQ